MWRKTIVACETQHISLSIKEWSRRGSPLVMIHGLGDASSIWNYFAIRAAPQFHVAAIDLRGHGDSDWDPEARYGTATFAADLTKAVAALGFDRMILIGHSLGADVAIRFAADHPARVAALIIVDFGPELRKVLRQSKTIQNGSLSGVRWLTQRCCDSSRANACAGPAPMVGRRRPMLRSRTVRKSAGSSRAMGAIATRNYGRRLLRSVARPWSSEEAVRECCLSTWRPGWSSARFGIASLRPSPQDTP
jgi:pimeloyl-ACP methyl ester carboxylesterase